ncbi:MAG: hypothetical protein IJ065_06830 [Eubacterium sp.]|nr:hypothetical protein [Eubacterium sp.]
MNNFSHVKDYFRQERTAFRNRPILWVIRILFVAIILYAGSAQWCFMVMGQAFSLGTTFPTEAERIIPFTDDEFKMRRLTRINMVWLRYFILGFMSYVLIFILKTPFTTPETILIRPYMYIAFFILQMAFLYYNFLDQIIEKKSTKFKLVTNKTEYIINGVTLITFFVYSIQAMRAPKHGFFHSVGIEWIHVAIMLATALVMIINCFRRYKNWKISDFESGAEKVQRAKGGMA